MSDDIAVLQLAKPIWQLEQKLQRASVSGSVSNIRQSHHHPPPPEQQRQQQHNNPSPKQTQTQMQKQKQTQSRLVRQTHSVAGAAYLEKIDEDDSDGDGTQEQRHHHHHDCIEIIDTLEEQIKELTTENEELVADFQDLLHEENENVAHLEDQGTRIHKLNTLNRDLRIQRDELAEEVERLRHRQGETLNPNSPSSLSSSHAAGDVLQIMAEAQRQMRRKQKRFAQEQQAWQSRVAAALQEKNDMGDELYHVSKSETKLTQTVVQYQRGLQKQSSDVRQLLDFERVLYEAIQQTGALPEEGASASRHSLSVMVVQKQCHDQTERLGKLLLDVETSLSMIRTGMAPVSTRMTAPGSVQGGLTNTRSGDDTTNTNGALSSHHHHIILQEGDEVEAAASDDADDCRQVSSGMASVSSFAKKMVTTSLDLGWGVSSRVTKGGPSWLRPPAPQNGTLPSGSG
jgi:hypothetical protein